MEVITFVIVDIMIDHKSMYQLSQTIINMFGMHKPLGLCMTNIYILA